MSEKIQKHIGDAIISASEVTKSFGQFQALRGINATI